MQSGHPSTNHELSTPRNQKATTKSTDNKEMIILRFIVTSNIVLQPLRAVRILPWIRRYFRLSLLSRTNDDMKTSPSGIPEYRSHADPQPAVAVAGPGPGGEADPVGRPLKTTPKPSKTRFLAHFRRQLSLFRQERTFLCKKRIFLCKKRTFLR